jgi:hypothetical protein
LSGQILLRLGRGSEASGFARFVADRWFGPDHDEAAALWNDVPESQRGPGNPLLDELPKDTQTAEGRVHSTTCPDHESMILELDRGDQASLIFHGKFPFMSGFSDTIWYGADHFSTCHHVEGLHAIIRYKPSTDNKYAGELAELELRQELAMAPESKTATVEKK